MLIARIFGVLLFVTLGVSVVAFIVTADRRWLRFAGQAFKLGVIILLIFMVLYVLERLIVAV